jgi:MOSC domain-containing protein YiiM
MQGEVTEILVSPGGGLAMSRQASAKLVPGKGIEGDRYHAGTGTFSAKLSGKPDREVTLIESEEIAAFNALTLFGYPTAAFRRNVVTAGVRLNELVGKEFCVGETRLRGIRLCEPCATLAGQLGPEVLQHMIHKCGLRAEVLSGGDIKPGDGITV